MHDEIILIEIESLENIVPVNECDYFNLVEFIVLTIKYIPAGGSEGNMQSALAVLYGFASVVVCRPSSVNIFFSRTTGPILTKFGM